MYSHQQDYQTQWQQLQLFKKKISDQTQTVVMENVLHKDFAYAGHQN